MVVNHTKRSSLHVCVLCVCVCTNLKFVLIHLWTCLPVLFNSLVISALVARSLLLIVLYCNVIEMFLFKQGETKPFVVVVVVVVVELTTLLEE